MLKKAKKNRIPDNAELTIKDFADARGTSVSRVRKSLHHRLDYSLPTSDDTLPNDVPLENTIKSRKFKTDGSSDPKYQEIHVTVWFLVAEHIRPEDVQSFALICQSTAAVVCHVSFWKSLHRRFLHHENQNPRLSCFRSNVIKSLYQTYPPFLDRLAKPTTTLNLDSLKGLRFVNCYFKEQSKVWIYCYKFWNRIKVRQPRILRREEALPEDYNLENMIAKFNNIFENSQEGFKILLVFTSRFIPMPMDCTLMVGQEFNLYGIRQILATDMRNNDLEIQLSRSTERFPAVTISYPSVAKFKILNWWDPDYKTFM